MVGVINQSVSDGVGWVKSNRDYYLDSDVDVGLKIVASAESYWKLHDQ